MRSSLAWALANLGATALAAMAPPAAPINHLLVNLDDVNGPLMIFLPIYLFCHIL
jgi:hypothetical protein